MVFQASSGASNLNRAASLLPINHSLTWCFSAMPVYTPATMVIGLGALEFGARVRLPNEAIIDILSRLPAKSLLRFKCVSKNFLHIIRESYFIDLHRKRTLSKNLKISINHQPGATEVEFSVHGFDGESKDQFSLSGFEKPALCMLSSSKHGLICINDLYGPTSYLLNPTTREVAMLPKSNLCGGFCFCFADLWFDAATITYKALRFVYFSKAPQYDRTYHLVMIEVLTLGTTCWRYVGDVPRTKTSIIPVFSHGAFHWLLQEEDDLPGDLKIMSFDVKEEKFSVISGPSQHPPESMLDILVSIDDKLCISFLHDSSLEMWMLKDYAIHIWCRKCIINLVGLTENLYSTIMILGHSNGLIIYDKELDRCFQYDPQTELWQAIDKTPTEVSVYTESLISPKALVHPPLTFDDNHISFEASV